MGGILDLGDTAGGSVSSDRTDSKASPIQRDIVMSLFSELDFVATTRHLGLIII